MITDDEFNNRHLNPDFRKWMNTQTSLFDGWNTCENGFWLFEFLYDIKDYLEPEKLNRVLYFLFRQIVEYKKTRNFDSFCEKDLANFIRIQVAINPFNPSSAKQPKSPPQ